MNVNSLNSLSSTYLQPSDSASQSSKNLAANGQLSTFAQLLTSSATSTAAEATSSTNSPNQMLSQLMSSFQKNGVQNQGQTLDPLAIG